MELVVGGTGVVGKRVALRLAEEGRTVRALVRGGRERTEASELIAAGIQVVDGDLTRADTLAEACAGVETVVTTVTSMPHGRDDGLRRVDHEGSLALIAAAEASGVRRFVYTSYSGNVRYDSPFETAKRGCEKRLLESGIQAVILRPSYFAEVWLGPHLGFDPAGRTAQIYGAGENRVSYISALDVAEFAVRTAVEERARGDLVLELGGPEPLSQLDAVRVFEEAIGEKMQVGFIPRQAVEAQHSTATDPIQKTFAALTLGYIDGDEIAEASAHAERYGIRLRSVGDYAAGFARDT